MENNMANYEEIMNKSSDVSLWWFKTKTHDELKTLFEEQDMEIRTLKTKKINLARECVKLQMKIDEGYDV
jgi:hypothetical protein